MAAPKSVDANQVAVVAAFRGQGASVLHLHTVGDGCPDLLVGFGGVDQLVEVKDGRKPESARRLRPDQQRFHAQWRGRPVFVVTSAAEAVALIQRIQRNHKETP